MKSNIVLLGLLASAATGILVGVLFAPNRCSRTRKNILNVSQDYAAEIKENFDEIVDAVAQKYESIWGANEGLVSQEQQMPENILP